jgi:hypothetical protein
MREGGRRMREVEVHKMGMGGEGGGVLSGRHVRVSA